MKRRDLLRGAGVTLLAASSFPFGWTAAAAEKKQKVLFFTRSNGFEHDAVKRKDDKLGFGEKALIDMGNKAGFEVEVTKDGAVFDGDLAKWDCIAFYTSGNLTGKGKNPGADMSEAGKTKLLAAIAAGKPFVGFHAATDSFRSAGIDPYIAMIGGEFVTHGAQQVATVTTTSPKFPGLQGIDKLSLNEEWYAQAKFAKDLHVIQVQETAGMKGDAYNRPNFPATWARMHQKGRVFYTSFGHRDDIWTNEKVQQIILGGMAWALGNVNADVTPNIEKVTPQANQLPPPAPKKA